MTNEEALSWPSLKAIAVRVHRYFRGIPGCYLEAEDFHIVGVAAVAMKLEANPELERGLLCTIAYRRMLDYGRNCADVRRHEWWTDDHGGPRGITQLDSVDYRLACDSSPYRSVIADEVRAWVETNQFGLTANEATALWMRFWEGYTDGEIVDRISTGGRSKSIARYWIRSGIAKIRMGLAHAELKMLQDRAEYHRQLRARSAECR